MMQEMNLRLGTAQQDAAASSDAHSTASRRVVASNIYKGISSSMSQIRRGVAPGSLVASDRK